MLNRNKELLRKILELYVDKDHKKFDPLKYEQWNPEEFSKANHCDSIIAQYHFDLLDEIGCFTLFQVGEENAATVCLALSWTGHELLEALRAGRQLQTVLTRLPVCNYSPNDEDDDF